MRRFSGRASFRSFGVFEGGIPWFVVMGEFGDLFTLGGPLGRTEDGAASEARATVE
jgi:hypothetical protein